MNAPEIPPLSSVQAWLDKALEDRAAALRLVDDPERFASTIAYHCQQATEKVLTAWLIQANTPFPWTHDLHILLELIRGTAPDLAEELRDVRVLSRFSVGTRYPSETVTPTSTEIDEAIKLTELAVSAIFRALGRKVE